MGIRRANSRLICIYSGLIRAHRLLQIQTDGERCAMALNFRPKILLASLLTFAGSAATAAPVPPRDIKAAGAALRAATVVDTQLFTPTVALGGCKLQPLARETDALPPRLQSAIEAAQAYSQAEQGIGLIILKGGRVIHESYAAPYTAATVTDSFSMHKSLMALTFGIALEAGIIKSVEDPAGKYIAEWKSDPRGKIPLRDFLSMQSGLKLYSFADTSSTEAMELLLGADINAVALRTPLQDAPKSIFRYNNANSQIVGIALERALLKHGYKNYAAYLAEKLWCPLGNGDAKLWLDRDGGAPHYYSGAFAHLADWARIGELIRQQGKVGTRQIVTAKWIAEMQKPSAANPNYGLHLWRGTPWQAMRRYSPDNPLGVIHSAPYKTDDVVFFDGFGGQRVYIVPSAGLTIVRSGFVNFKYDDAAIVNLVLGGL
jgi:CubicO group peptidase (beta-lactamase class C family)